MIQNNQQEYEKMCNTNWDSLLKIFKNVSGKPEEQIEKYTALKELAKTKPLTPRQAEGISARCNYQIHLINNPKEKHFSNSERKEDRTLTLDKASSNGTH